MKIEHERDGERERWRFEVDPVVDRWVARAPVVILVIVAAIVFGPHALPLLHLLP